MLTYGLNLRSACSSFSFWPLGKFFSQEEEFLRGIKSGAGFVVLRLTCLSDYRLQVGRGHRDAFFTFLR